MKMKCVQSLVCICLFVFLFFAINIKGICLSIPVLSFWNTVVVIQRVSLVPGIVLLPLQLQQSPTNTARPLSTPYVWAAHPSQFPQGFWDSQFHLLLPHNNGSHKAVWCQSISNSMHPWVSDGERLIFSEQLCYEMCAKTNHRALKKISSFYFY